MIYVTGDTHGPSDLGRFTAGNFPGQKTMGKEDYLIIAGDFGLVWNDSEEEKYWRRWYDWKNFTTLVVDGNHENFDLLDAYPEYYWNGGKVHYINGSIIHLMRGQVYTLQGVKIFTMGGGQSIDKHFREPGFSWWEKELPTPKEYREAFINLERYNWQVNYIITHDCSKQIFDGLKDRLGLIKNSNPLRDFLDQIEERVSYKHWYFGHYHDDFEVDDCHTLLYRNIMRII